MYLVTHNITVIYLLPWGRMLGRLWNNTQWKRMLFIRGRPCCSMKCVQADFSILFYLQKTRHSDTILIPAPSGILNFAPEVFWVKFSFRSPLVNFSSTADENLFLIFTHSIIVEYSLWSKDSAMQ